MYRKRRLARAGPAADEQGFVARDQASRMKHDVGRTLANHEFGNVGLQAWHQFIESASRDTGSVVENASLTVDLNNAESIFDLFADAAGLIEQRG
jgi:hypothetical protein